MDMIVGNIELDALYELRLKSSTVTKLVELLLLYREREKKESHIDNIVYVVYANCRGDALDYRGEGFVFECSPNLIFVDPCSLVGVNRLIAHELIHYFQSFLYFIDGLNDFDDWTEVMARDLEVQVSDILFKENGSTKKLISKNVSKVEKFVENFKTMKPQEDLYEYEKSYDAIEDYFESRFLEHLGMGGEQ